MMSRRRRASILGACAVVIATALAGVAVGTSGSDSSEAPQSVATDSLLRQPGDIPTELAEFDPADPPARHEPPGVPIREVFPAKMLPPRFQGFYSTALLWPMRNGWQVSNHETFTAVYAGGDGTSNRDESSGRFLIYRQNYVQLTEETTIVDVPEAGPVKVVSAPLGDNAGAWAQERGVLRFEGAAGLVGTLDLSSDSVTIDGT